MHYPGPIAELERNIGEEAAVYGHDERKEA
jgi:hypothetical protein